MDKKSNRTDLLAAGREKLRQYRQKKDNKGKDGKGKDGKGNTRSSNKADKSGKYDSDVDKPSAVLKMKAESSKLPEREVESNLSVQAIVETMVDSSIDLPKDLENCEGTSTSFHDVDQFVPPAVDVGEQAVLNVPFDRPGLDPVLLEASSNRELLCNIPNVEGKVNVDVNEGVVSLVSVGLEIVHDDSVTCTPDSTSGVADRKSVV